MNRLLILHSRRLFDGINQIQAWLYRKTKQVLIFVTFFLSFSASAESLIKFDIDKQRADKAIIAFAQQTYRTIIFSFDLVKQHHANRLKGYYSIKSGLEQLLYGTDLKAAVNNIGYLSITYKQ